jgi:hypothetical protein
MSDGSPTTLLDTAKRPNSRLGLRHCKYVAISLGLTAARAKSRIIEMIVKPTVLILGAGASYEYGLPLGFALLQQIHEWCGRARVETSYIEMLRKFQIIPELATEFAASLDGCHSESIDDLLETRPNFKQIGKAAIAMLLLAAEKVDVIGRIKERNKQWYSYLFSRIKGNKPTDLANNQITIVTFNYDRSIEQAYRVTFAHNHGCNTDMIDQFMKSVPIIHLHGILGTVQENPYGSPLTPASFERAMNGIKTVDEVNDTAHRGAFEIARAAIQAADKIIILGFGFHPTNLRRLRLAESHGQIWATCYGMAGAARTTASTSIRRQVVWSDPTETIRQFLERENCLFC